MTGKLLAGAQEDCGEQVGRQLDHLSLINEALPLAETSAVEVLIEVFDCAFRRSHKFRLAMIVQKSTQVRILPDPLQVMAHKGENCIARSAAAVKFGEKALLIVTQIFDIERRSQLLLAS